MCRREKRRVEEEPTQRVCRYGWADVCRSMLARDQVKGKLGHICRDRIPAEGRKGGPCVRGCR